MPTTTVTTDSFAEGGLTYCRVDRLSDSELLASTRGLVGRSNQILGALLAHLAEVETRGLHRSKACSSLYTYCVYELRFSEDAASRRVCAARLVKRFPALLQAVANGELHLTGLLMLAPYFTPQNQLELLARAKFRTKKELAKLVRILDPLPDVPAQIVALGPAPAMTANASPDWQSFAHSLCPPVRELASGDRPRDWATDPLTDDERVSESVDVELSPLTRQASPGAETAVLAPKASASVESFNATLARDASLNLESRTAALARDASLTSQKRPPNLEPLTAGPARDASPSLESLAAAAIPEEPPSALTPPQRYQVQFTASEEHAQLVERAQALLSGPAGDGGSLAEIHLRAMRAFVAELEKQKYGAARPRQRGERTERGEPVAPAEPAATERTPQVAEPPRPPSSEAPRQRVRYVPAAERRAAFERDGARCSYVDARGQRCRETRGLELHHLIPFARDGAHSSANLALFCRAHNTLAAEEDFGRGLVETKRHQSGHESWAAQGTNGSSISLNHPSG